MNTVAKTTVPWKFDALIVCRAIGTSGNFFGFASLLSEALLGGLPSASGDSSIYLSAVSGGADTAPAVSGSVDLTVANTFDCFFTQTVATGQFIVHNFVMESGSVALA